jgi:hypothetical protein
LVGGDIDLNILSGSVGTGLSFVGGSHADHDPVVSSLRALATKYFGMATF